MKNIIIVAIYLLFAGFVSANKYNCKVAAPGGVACQDMAAESEGMSDEVGTVTGRTCVEIVGPTLKVTVETYDDFYFSKSQACIGIDDTGRTYCECDFFEQKVRRTTRTLKFL
jgi:hypothetical protein